MYDYVARIYDQALGRFNVIDPWAEKFDNQSPIEGGALVKGSGFLFEVVKGSEVLGTLFDSFAQRGNNNGRLQDDGLEAI